MDAKHESCIACDILVIGYGNTLRRDDGVGAKVAEAVEALNLSGVRTIACHQLTPELAEPISQARTVIFVDAATDTKGEAELREIHPAEVGQILAHASDPRSLLALAKQVFGRCPAARALAIPVEDLGLGDGLSSVAQRGFNRAIDLVREFQRQQQDRL